MSQFCESVNSSLSECVIDDPQNLFKKKTTKKFYAHVLKDI